MKNAIQTFKGDHFFHDKLHLYVNRATENFDSPYHDHDFIEFAYVAEGVGFHHTQAGENKVSKVSKGQLFFLPVGFSHVFRPVSTDTDKHPLIVYNCLFRSDLAERLCEFVSEARLQSFLASISNGSQGYFAIMDNDGLIEKLFLSLHREYTLPQEAFPDYLNALLLQLLIHVHRMLLPSLGQVDAYKKQLTDIHHLLKYVEQNYEQELTLKKLGNISGWSDRHLQRLFKKHTEQSFHRYLQSLRMQKSCELLKATQLKISVIADMVGYKDMGSYLSVFKRSVGCTPSQYRNV